MAINLVTFDDFAGSQVGRKETIMTNDIILKGKKGKIFIKNLNFKPVIYICTILEDDGTFLKIKDLNNDILVINKSDIIQFREEE